MGPNAARWIYHDDRFTITIRVATSLHAPACRLSIEVERGGPLEFRISHDVVLGENEYHAPAVSVDAARARVELRPAPDGPGPAVPEATFFIVSPDADQIEVFGGDGLLHADGADRGGAARRREHEPFTRFSVVLTGSILDAGRAEARATETAAGRISTSRPETLTWSERRMASGRDSGRTLILGGRDPAMRR